MKKFFQILFVVFGCLHLAGGPYSMLQAYAWANMLVDYSKDEGLLQAAKDTFGGEKPCALCCKIKTARQSEPKEKTPISPASTLSAKQLQEILPMGEIVILPAASTELPPVLFTDLQLSRGIGSAAPPSPPPCLVG